MKKVELLAPAGNYDAFLGAIHAGADAVYLGGMKYSARAFADNFDEETLCHAISYAHLFGRKVYLTMNTLVKQSELEEVYSFLRPFYLEGLDGVIVQDIGLFQYIKRHFPGLELHISTQMALTGPHGVKMLKELGASRVVPAREISLKEVQRIKEEGLEVETFVHGAMCYCYSGQCFFSSLLGGRSGNRGKCAQSCRLPYQVNLPEGKKGKNQEEYPLSLKDLCSIERLPELIKAGIDSFKIEGRMKRPEYAAGVTAIYRKYIDLCYEANCSKLKIEEDDWNKLRNLYIRTDIQDGYYYRHNGAEMVTLHKPSYSGVDDALVAKIKEEYIDKPLKAEVEGIACMKKGEPLTLSLTYGIHRITEKGPIVDQALKKAVSKEDIVKQLKKTGNTNFIFSSLQLDMEDDVFLPLKSLNEIRRAAFSALEDTINKARKEERKNALQNPTCLSEYKENVEDGQRLQIFVSTDEQCLKACNLSLDAVICVASDLFIGNESKKIISALRKREKEGGKIWIKLPEVLRNKDIHYMDDILKKTKDFTQGMVISNMESYGFLQNIDYKGEIVLNYHMYIWNKESIAFWKERAVAFCAPLECNKKEWENLDNPGFTYLCYGRIPMMVTANCIRKTKLSCRDSGVSNEESLTDRYGANFPVQINCNYCYNIIYNSVPLSLHGYLDALKKLPGRNLRLDFTTETGDEMVRIVEEFEKARNKQPCDFSFIKEYTTGHYKKGAL